MQPIFDAPWKQRATAGDPQAVEQLATEAIEPLWRFCFYRLGRDRHLCEEVVQETLLKALRDLAKYEPERAENSIFGWLTGLARNEIHRALSRQQRAASLEALWQRMDRELLDLFARLDSEPYSSELLEREETREMVNATMSQLPPHYRQALEAKYVLGQSVRDIALAWSLTEKAVESQLTRARAAFRATFTALARNLSIEPSV